VRVEQAHQTLDATEMWQFDEWPWRIRSEPELHLFEIA
jgi:hypothetical protein